MLRLIIVGILIFFVSRAFGKDIYVFEAKRPLSLYNGQTLPKDYFINAGSESGLQKDVVVTVTRRQSLYDPYQNKSAGDIMVPVAELRIIYAQDGMSVARMEKMMERTYLPTLDIEAVMVGDRLDLGSVRKSSKRASAFAPVAPSAPVYGPMPATVTESAEFSSMAPNIIESDVTVNTQTM